MSATKSLCPHLGPFAFGDREISARGVVERLGSFVSHARRERIDAVIANRTYTVTPVLEGLYDRGNASAVIRSAEAMGYQSVHVVESSERFKEANRVTQGAEKWMDITCWETTAECLAHLRGLGYTIVATQMESATPIGDFDFTQPTALFFGNEKEGVSNEVLDAADERLVVPMLGFTRSYNVSVAAALCLYHVCLDRQTRRGGQGDLSEEEREGLKAWYYFKSVEHAERILAQD